MSARQFLIAAMVAVVVGSKLDYYPLVFVVFVAMVLERPFPKVSNLDSHWDFVVAVVVADFVVVVAVAVFVVVFVFDYVVFGNWVVQHVSIGPNLDSHRDFVAVFAVVVALAVVVVVVVVVFALHVVAVGVLGCVAFVVEIVVVVVVEVLGAVSVSLCLLAAAFLAAAFLAAAFLAVAFVVDDVASAAVVAAVFVAPSATTRCIRSRLATHSRLLLLMLLRLIDFGVAPSAPILTSQSEIFNLFIH
jgi:hypothetical protein